jgi:hypothetical protein
MLRRGYRTRRVRPTVKPLARGILAQVRVEREQAASTESTSLVDFSRSRAPRKSPRPVSSSRAIARTRRPSSRGAGDVSQIHL